MHRLANPPRTFRAAALPLPHAWPGNTAKDEFSGLPGQHFSGTRQDLSLSFPSDSEQFSFSEHGLSSPASTSIPLVPQSLRSTPKMRAVSSTAVPLRFRRPPQSPLLVRHPPETWSTDSVPSPSEARTRPKHFRARSTGFRSSSTDFRPLYLVERNRGPRQSIHAYQPFLSRHDSYSAVSSDRERELYPCAPETLLEAFYTPLENSGGADVSEYYRAVERRTTSQQTKPDTVDLRSPFSLMPMEQNLGNLGQDGVIEYDVKAPEQITSELGDANTQAAIPVHIKFSDRANDGGDAGEGDGGSLFESSKSPADKSFQVEETDASALVGEVLTPIDYFNYRDILGEKLETFPADPIDLNREPSTPQNKVQPVGELGQHDDVEEAKNVPSSRNEEGGKSPSGAPQEGAAKASVCGPGVPTPRQEAKQLDVTSGKAYYNRGFPTATKIDEDDGIPLLVTSNASTFDLTHSKPDRDHAIDDIINTGLSVSGFALQLDEHRELTNSINSPVDLDGDEEEEVVMRSSSSPQGVLSVWRSYSMRSRSRSSRGSSQGLSASCSPFKDKDRAIQPDESLANISLGVVPFDLLQSKLTTNSGTDSTQNVDKCSTKPWCCTSTSSTQLGPEEAPAGPRNDLNLKSTTEALATSNDAQDTNVQLGDLKSQSPQGFRSGEDLPSLVKRGSFVDLGHHEHLEPSDIQLNQRLIDYAPLKGNGKDRSERGLGMFAATVDVSLRTLHSIFVS